MKPDARLALLLGDPVARSLSPAIHNAAFAAADIDATYLATRVGVESLEAAVAGLRAPNVLGANVTIPHKRAVLPHLDRLSPEAAVIGAVNAIVREDDGALVGHNTDAAGFLAPLDLDRLRGRPALIFGSGGAARAVAYALLTHAEPEMLTLAARTPERADALASGLTPLDPAGALRVVPLAEAVPAVRRAALVVNATPLGMHPRPDTTPWPNDTDFSKGQTVYDLVYAPRVTRLLRDAAARGATAIGGLEMLIGQAAETFRLWTGRPMPMGAVRVALAEAAA